MSTVKRQHYVWRHYLRPWAPNDRIHAFFKKDKKVIPTNLMNVAQEKYFYRLIDLTAKEEAFFKKFITHTTGNLVKDLNLDFLQLFTSTSKLKSSLKTTLNPDVDKEKYEEEIRTLEINLMEISHGKIEELGYKIISIRNKEDLITMDKDENLFEAIMYLCFQYFRTRNMRNIVLQSFEGDKLEALVKKTWNIISYIMATNLAQNILLDPKLKICLFQNNTTESFITGDQPIFNQLSENVNINGEVKELDFYYPISPQHALSIHFSEEQSKKYDTKNVDLKFVEAMNNKVFGNSDFFIFSDKKEQLEKWL